MKNAVIKCGAIRSGPMIAALESSFKMQLKNEDFRQLIVISNKEKIKTRDALDRLYSYS